MKYIVTNLRFMDGKEQVIETEVEAAYFSVDIESGATILVFYGDEDESVAAFSSWDWVKKVDDGDVS